jgi:hypothetical protein
MNLFAPDNINTENIFKKSEITKVSLNKIREELIIQATGSTFANYALR